jgi:hypothetical protein
MFAKPREPRLARRLLDRSAMRLVVVVIAAWLATAPRSAAAEGQETPAADERSEHVATAWAAGATAFGLAFLATGAKDGSVSLVMGGMLFAGIGPSAGHLYTGEEGHAPRISLARVAGLILIALGDATRGQFTDQNCVDCGPGPKLTGRGNAMIAIGAVAYATLTIYDLYDAHRSARRVNQRAREKKTVRLVAPTVVPTASGAVPAIGFTGTF